MKLNTLSPPLGNIFGKTAGSVQGFLYYSPKCRSLGYRWSKQRLYHLLGKNVADVDDPERILGLESGMTFSGLKDPYERASVIEYLCYLRFTGGHKVQSYWVN
jgi:cytochrome c2